MGVTVFYRGRIDDLERIEDFEDRVLDLALEIGAEAQIWRSVAENDPRRMVRGMIVDLAPGQETTSLLLSPEGWLIPLTDIEDAELGRLAEPPWCFIKTQYGPVEGHVALIELLDALKKEFIPGLEVRDEGGYWETRDTAALAQNFTRVQTAIDGLVEGLQRHGLSSEAAEDPDILATRIERVARLVQATIARPPEHPPVTFEGDDFDPDDDFGTEAEWDAAYKENRRKQERLGRAIEERAARGEDHGDALENAMRDEGIIDLPDEPSTGDAEHDFETDEFDGFERFDEEEDEPWRESLSEHAFDDGEAALGSDDDEGDEDDVFDDRDERHPLQRRVRDLMLRLHQLSKGLDRSVSHLDILHRGAGEMMGGLAQALSPGFPGRMDGWDLMQLRRALRGAAFARGALFPLRAEGVISDAAFDELRATIERLESDIMAEVNRVRSERNESE